MRAVLGTLQYADGPLIINPMWGGPWESQPIKLSCWRMALSTDVELPARSAPHHL